MHIGVDGTNGLFEINKAYLEVYDQTRVARKLRGNVGTGRGFTDAAGHDRPCRAVARRGADPRDLHARWMVAGAESAALTGSDSLNDHAR